MHYRGTDKLPSSSGSEDNPLHLEYEFCRDLILDYLKNTQIKEEICLFIASDEQPFVDYMQKAGLSIEVVGTDSLRSEISTSGLFTTTDTSMCAQGISQSAVCATFNELILDSVHRGLPDASKYVKGENVLIDVLVLAGSQTFFRSRGNVSNFVCYIQPECKILDMVYLYFL